MPVVGQHTFERVSEPTAKELLLGTLGPLVSDETDLVAALPALMEFARAYASPTFVCAMFPLPPTPAVEYPGADGLERAWRDWAETFESVRVEAEDLRDRETAVVLLAEQIAVTRHGSVEIRQPSAMAWLFSDRQLERLEFHLDREAALRAGGF